jgi:hypothetical protein
MYIIIQVFLCTGIYAAIYHQLMQICKKNSRPNARHPKPPT